MPTAATRELHCRRLGHGPDLVLLHGWGLHGGIWQPVLEALSPHFRLHVYDLPGHGYSSAYPEFTLDAACDALARTAPAAAHWLGWSLGGLLALEFTARHPDRVRRLVLAASNPKFVAAADWPHAMAPEVLAGFARALDADYDETLRRFLSLVARGAPDNGVLRTLRAAVGAAPAPSSVGLHGGLAILREADLRVRLDAMRLPVLLVAGARDTLVPAAALRASAENNPQVRLHEFADAGHAPFVSHPQAFVAMLTEFLR